MGGPISANTTWALADSPINVRFSVIVSEGVTLTVEPGVKITFSPGISIQVDGELIARGTAGQEITFTDGTGLEQPGSWGQIKFSSTAKSGVFDANGNYQSGSILEFCVIENAGLAGTTAVAAIEGSLAAPFISKCVIRNNKSKGIFLTGTSMKLIGNTIESSGGSGISINNGTVVTIDGNTISGNSSGGVMISSATTATLSNNTISGNKDTGVDIFSATTATLSNNTISGNSSSVYSSSNKTSITGNVIIKNKSTSGGGVYIGGAGKGITITDNEISDNESNSAILIRGITVINRNNILNNIGKAMENRDAQGTPNMDATNNWWGTTDTFAIRSDMIDFFTDSSRGQIDIEPVATSAFAVGRSSSTPKATPQPTTGVTGPTPILTPLGGSTPNPSGPTPTPTQTPIVEEGVPEADFKGAPLIGAAPLNVQFTDVSKGGPTGWAWEFSDGGIAFDQNPSHLFQQEGLYTVKLEVSNSFGSDIIEKR